MPFPFGNKKSNDSSEPGNLESLSKILGADKLKELEALIAKEKAIPPKVAVIGKAGVGKTTTINNVFNAQFHTSHTVAGTKKAQQEDFTLSGGGVLTVFDMPGLGEDIDEDKKYIQIYKDILPKVDVVLYVLQANARDFSADQDILKNVISNSVKDLKKRIVVGLNQVDKIGPGNWDQFLNYPSKEQEISIKRKCEDITSKLASYTGISKDRIVYYSAAKRYRLHDLLLALIKAADDLGWKLPVDPKDPFDLADREVQAFVADQRAKKLNPK